MEITLTKKEREELQKKLIQTLKDQISHLSTELQQILADDLITALQNRLTALTRIQTSQKPTTQKDILAIHKPFIETPTKQT